MDIDIKTENLKFKFRVCGILQASDKFLAIRMDNNPFFCLPGGHVEIGEDTITAVQREMNEELGFEVQVEKLVTIIESFYKTTKNISCHELGYYYLVKAKNEKAINTQDYEKIENDKGKLKHLDFKWFTLNELKQIDFRPKEILDLLSSDTLSNIIIHS